MSDSAGSFCCCPEGPDEFRFVGCMRNWDYIKPFNPNYLADGTGFSLQGFQFTQYCTQTGRTDWVSGPSAGQWDQRVIDFDPDNNLRSEVYTYNLPNLPFRPPLGDFISITVTATSITWTYTEAVETSILTNEITWDGVRLKTLNDLSLVPFGNRQETTPGFFVDPNERYTTTFPSEYVAVAAQGKKGGNFFQIMPDESTKPWNGKYYMRGLTGANNSALICANGFPVHVPFDFNFFPYFSIAVERGLSSPTGWVYEYLMEPTRLACLSANSEYRLTKGIRCLNGPIYDFETVIPSANAQILFPYCGFQNTPPPAIPSEYVRFAAIGRAPGEFSFVDKYPGFLPRPNCCPP